MKLKRILVVEDEVIVAADLEARLSKLGYEPIGITGLGEEALPKAADLKADLALMDIQLKGAVDGVAAANQIRDTLNIPVVFLTAHVDEATFARARISSPFGYVLKPFTDRELHTAIEIALHRHATEDRLKRVQDWLAAVIESIGSGLVVTDEWGLVQVMNRAASSLSGWTPEEAFLHPFDEVFHSLDATTLEPVHFPIAKTLDDFLVSPTPFTVKLQVRSGPTTLVGCSHSVIRDANGAVTGMVWLLTDQDQQATVQRQAGAA